MAADGGAFLAKMKGLIGRLRALGDKQFTRKVATQMAAEALRQVKSEFREARDPYGRAWAPRKAKRRPDSSTRGQPLLNTGRLRNSFSSNGNEAGFRVGTNVSYAIYHQYGAPKAKIPVRAMLPSQGNLGPIWRAALHKIFDDSMKRHMKG